MTRILIRLDEEVTDELISVFPRLTSTLQPTHSTITGEVSDQEELQGVLNFLTQIGVGIVDVVTIPD